MIGSARCGAIIHKLHSGVLSGPASRMDDVQR